MSKVKSCDNLVSLKIQSIKIILIPMKCLIYWQKGYNDFHKSRQSNLFEINCDKYFLYGIICL